MSNLHDKEAFFKEAREMAEGLTREQLIGYYMAELKTCCECEEKLKVSEKTNTKIMDYAVDLEKQIDKDEQDKIEFTIEKLEKVKEKFGYKHNSQLVISSKQLVEFIDNQIKQLKGEE